MSKRQRERESRRLRRHRRVRRKVEGSTERPRLVVHRSLKHIQGQLVDDTTGRVIVGVSTLSAPLRDEEGTKKDRSKAAGKLLAEKAKEAGVERVVFDRGGLVYHGRVAAFAEGAREGGLDF